MRGGRVVLLVVAALLLVHACALALSPPRITALDMQDTYDERFGDHEDDVLIGISGGPPVSLPHFGGIDPNTGVNAWQTAGYNNMLFSQSIGSVDAKNRIFYTVVQSNGNMITAIIGIDASSGDVVRRVEMPFLPFQIAGYGHYVQFAADTGVVYATGRATKPDLYQQHQILSISPNNTLSVIANLGDMNMTGEPLPGGSAYDPVHGLFWMLAGLDIDDAIHIYAFDIKTGARRYRLTDGPNSFVSFGYDAKTGDIFGIGMRDDPVRRFIFSWVRLQTSTATLVHVVDLPQFYDMILGEMAVESATRKAYLILNSTPLSTTGTNPRSASHYHAKRHGYTWPQEAEQHPLGDPFGIVQINLDTGAVISTGTPCGDGCPVIIQSTHP